MVLPLLKSGGLSIGKELVKGAADVLGDIGNNVNTGEAFKKRGTDVLTNLKKRAFAKMSGLDGEGYNKSAKRRKVSQSSVKRSTKRKKKTTASKPVKKRKTAGPKKKKTKPRKTTAKRKTTVKRKTTKKRSSKQLAAAARPYDFFS